jgi:hypothetical protein
MIESKIDPRNRRTIALPYLTEEEAQGLCGLLMHLIDGREDFDSFVPDEQQPPAWRALLRILYRVEQV